MMEPLSNFPPEARRRIDIVMTDIDDTLTEDGRLPAVAYSAMEALHEAGLRVIPVTGRPAGWADLIARQWPVDAVVGENGAFYFRYDGAERRMIRRYVRDEHERRSDRERLELIRRDVLQHVPAAAVASDQSYRDADLAIDICEDIPPISMAETSQILSLFRKHGATAKLSSIHVNGWFGSYDKLTTSGLLLRECFAIDIDADRERIVYVGDSPNDSPMFEFFPNAVGVANVRKYGAQLPSAPRWVTESPMAKGFAEIAESILEAKVTS
jgi:HAD superfamily hydrolase (TIGR01484 family)